MVIFITGGTGFLGQQLIKRLKKNYSGLSGLARSERSVKELASLDITPVLGSLENIEQWKGNLVGVDTLIHCAAPVEFWGSWEKYQTGIVEATENLYKEAERAGVKRFIFLSSESVLQDSKDLINIDESEPYPNSPNSYYGKSKMIAEQFILAQKSNMTSIIIRPTFIWGNDVPALDTMLQKINSKDFMWVDNGKSAFEMVHVDNVAEAIALACEKGTDKGIYFVTDDNSQPIKEFLIKLFKTQGVDAPNKNIPKWLATILASIVEKIWRGLNLKSDPPLTKFDLSFVSMGRRYKIDKIKNDLGYKPIITEAEGLKKMSDANKQL